jgi:glycine cleavage system transcriptional repressor
MPQLVITAVGPDRPGLVGEFTGRVFAAGANLADSRMVNLKGQFALLVLVEGSHDVVARVKQDLSADAPRMGLAVSYADHGTPVPAAPGLPFRLKTYSLDQPGIVHRVTALLQKHGINIEDLQSSQQSAAFAGGSVFTMELRMTVPPRVQVKALRVELDALCAEMNCDLDLESA